MDGIAERVHVIRDTRTVHQPNARLRRFQPADPFRVDAPRDAAVSLVALPRARRVVRGLLTGEDRGCVRNRKLVRYAFVV